MNIVRIFVCMKTEVSLLVEEDLLKKAEEYAANNETKLNTLFENYLRTLTVNGTKTFLELIHDLPKLDISEDVDLKTVYAEEMRKKYGC